MAMTNEERKRIEELVERIGPEIDRKLERFNPTWSLDARATAAFDLLSTYSEALVWAALESVEREPPTSRTLAATIERMPRA